MNVYYSKSLSREEFLQRAFRSEGITLPEEFPRTKNGKPLLSKGDFSLTHTGNFLAAAFSPLPVGLDAETGKFRRLDAILSRLTEREKREDFFELWTAKEAYIKLCGGTIAELLPHLTYEQKKLYKDGELLPVSLQHFAAEDTVLCVCTAQKTPVKLISLE